MSHSHMIMGFDFGAIAAVALAWVVFLKNGPLAYLRVVRATAAPQNSDNYRFRLRDGH